MPRKQMENISHALNRRGDGARERGRAREVISNDSGEVKGLLKDSRGSGERRTRQTNSRQQSKVILPPTIRFLNVFPLLNLRFDISLMRGPGFLPGADGLPTRVLPTTMLDKSSVIPKIGQTSLTHAPEDLRFRSGDAFVILRPMDPELTQRSVSVTKGRRQGEEEAGQPPESLRLFG